MAQPDLGPLMRLARAAAAARGHDLGPFARHSEASSARSWAIAHCQRRGCAGEVTVDDRPPANGIDIGGTAVALNCPTSAPA